MILYGRPGCSQCEVKKQELARDRIQYTYVDIDKLTSDELQTLVNNNGGRTSLPILVSTE